MMTAITTLMSCVSNPHTPIEKNDAFFGLNENEKAEANRVLNKYINNLSSKAKETKVFLASPHLPTKWGNGSNHLLSTKDPEKINALLELLKQSSPCGAMSAYPMDHLQFRDSKGRRIGKWLGFVLNDYGLTLFDVPGNDLGHYHITPEKIRAFERSYSGR